MSAAPSSAPTIDAFIARWQNADGTELANAHVFERRIVFRHGDGGFMRSSAR